MSAELVETTRLFGRTVAEIDPGWIEGLAHHLVKRNFFEPWFDPEHAHAQLPEVLQEITVVAGEFDREACRRLPTHQRVALPGPAWRTP